MTAKRSRRSFGYVRKLPSGMVQASYLGPDGKRHNAPTTFQSKIDAGAWLSTVQAKIIEKRWKPETDAPIKITLDAYADIWLQDRKLKPRTRLHYRQLLDGRILPTFCGRDLSTITAPDIRAWHSAQGDDHPTARASAYGLLTTIMGSAVEDELISTNPCHIRGASTSKRKHEIQIVTTKQLETIMEHMPERYRLMILLGTWCALRFGEVTELRRKDVDLRNGRIHVQRAVSWVHHKPMVGDPKTDAGSRTVAMPPHILDTVKQHLLDHVPPSDLDALLFSAARRGDHLTYGSFFSVWKPARHAAGRDDLRFHDLRHTGLTLAAQSGATLAELMNRAGHTTPAKVMRYQHASADRDAEIARRLSLLATAE